MLEDALHSCLAVLLLHATHLQVGRGFSAPREHPWSRGERVFLQFLVYQQIVLAVDDGLAMLKEVEFLAGLLAQIAKILVMRMAQIGDDADGGTDDALEPYHLPGLGDACLK